MQILILPFFKQQGKKRNYAYGDQGYDGLPDPDRKEGPAGPPGHKGIPGLPGPPVSKTLDNKTRNLFLFLFL